MSYLIESSWHVATSAWVDNLNSSNIINELDQWDVRSLVIDRD
jgi:hypothetical protein